MSDTLLQVIFTPILLLIAGRLIWKGYDALKKGSK